ncbi:MAG: DUF1788 domain-containing protein [Actinobacteria bacterium]|nr:DUF1788 domain-containing protein [Actinomycetota bacterium]
MSAIDTLLRKYTELIRLPWAPRAAGPEKVFMLVYPPRDERRLRAKIDEFEIATKQAGRGWALVDLTNAFAHWMAEQEYRDNYFEHPEEMSMVLDTFGDHLEIRVASELDAAGENAVVALMGLGSLFGLYSVSAVLDRVNDHVKGRLLAFFPGVREGNNYRLLDAKDGWSYLAIPIDLTEDDT